MGVVVLDWVGRAILGGAGHGGGGRGLSGRLARRVAERVAERVAVLFSQGGAQGTGYAKSATVRRPGVER